MSIIEPKIDVLLNETDNDRFLLCALASKRAHDINDMMRGQRDRAIPAADGGRDRARGRQEAAVAGFQRNRPRRSVVRSQLHRRQLPLRDSVGLRPTELLDAAKPRGTAPCRFQALVAYGSTLPRAFAALQGASGLLADVLRPTCVFVSRYARSLCHRRISMTNSNASAGPLPRDRGSRGTIDRRSR